MNSRKVQVANGIVRIEQRTRVPRREIGTDVSGPTCIYAHVVVKRGAVSYIHGDGHIRAPVQFAVFVPPFTVVQALLDRCDVTSVALAFRPPPSAALPPHPVLLPPDPDGPLTTAHDVVHRLRTVERLVNVARASDPAPLAARVKDIIDAEYATTLDIGRIAVQLEASPAVVSRAFKKTYGIPPVRYRHHVRIMDALTRLAEGAYPIEVFQDVGFDDLSRFYKLFRKVACSTPGLYRSRRSKNAKTRTD